MGKNHYKWSNKQLREHVEVLDGKRKHTHIIKECNIFKFLYARVDDSEYLDI